MRHDLSNVPCSNPTGVILYIREAIMSKVILVSHMPAKPYLSTSNCSTIDNITASITHFRQVDQFHFKINRWSSDMTTNSITCFRGSGQPRGFCQAIGLYKRSFHYYFEKVENFCFHRSRAGQEETKVTTENFSKF